MEAASSSSTSTTEVSLSSWDYVNLLLLRPAFAIAFVLFLICLGWLLAWKLVLVHVPLVQEICGLRKKPVKPKPPTGRLSKIYNSIYTRDYASGCGGLVVWSQSYYFMGVTHLPCIMVFTCLALLLLHKNSLDRGRANFANCCVKEKSLWKNRMDCSTI